MKIETIEKTEKLSGNRFQRGTQKFYICQALASLPARISMRQLVDKVKELPYEDTFKGPWAKSVGEKAFEESVRYHLPSLEELGMVVTSADASADSTLIADADIQASMETTFGLERDLQSALRENIVQLEAGLKITDGGKERAVPSGRIDILAGDSRGVCVVIELKACTADGNAIGQILAYMGDLLEETKGKIRGILVARDFTSRAIAASKAVSNIELKEYRFTFSFKDVHAAPAEFNRKN